MKQKEIKDAVQRSIVVAIGRAHIRGERPTALRRARVLKFPVSANSRMARIKYEDNGATCDVSPRDIYAPWSPEFESGQQKKAAPKKVTPVTHKIKHVPIGKMFIDYADEGGYQRAKHEENALRIAEEFEPARYEPIHLSLRGDGRYAVVEGQTRYWVAVLRGITTLQAIIHEGLTRATEARLCADLWKGRRAGSAFERFRAELTAGNPMIASLNALVESAGWRVGQGTAVGRIIRAVTALETAHKQHGAEALTKALWLLEPWAEDHAPTGSVLHGMVDFVAEFCDVDLKRVRAKLEKIPAATIERRAKAKAGRTGIGMHTYIALEIDAEIKKYRRKTGHLEAIANAA